MAVADPRGITGQAVKAFIVLIDGASEPIALHEIIGFMHGKIESYKMPVDVEVVDQIPKTESGKIKRSDLQT